MMGFSDVLYYMARTPTPFLLMIFPN